MADCPVCGAAMEEGQGLCEACASNQPADAPAKVKHSFDSVCGCCGALLPAGRERCLVCHTPRAAAPYQGQFPVPSDREPVRHSFEKDGASRKTPELWRKWCGGVAGAVVLVLAVLVGLGVYQQYFDTSGYLAGQSVLYVNAAGRLMLDHPGLDRSKEIIGVAPDKADGGEATASGNGRYVVYTTASGELYLLDLATRAMAESDRLQVVRLAEELMEPVVFSGNSEYIVYLNTRGELYASNLSESWRLDTGVAEIVSVDDRKVLYTRRGERDGQRDLYLKDLAQSGSAWYSIDHDVAQVLDWTKGFDRVLYTSTRQDGDGEDTLCLQLFELGRDITTTLVTGVGRVVDASAERLTAVYIISQPQIWEYKDFINDDYAMRDAIHREPDLEDYPLVASALETYGEDSELLEQMEDEAFVEEFGAYLSARNDWEDKLYRDDLRTLLRRAYDTIDQPLELCDLYVYQNGSSALVDTGVVGSDGLSAEDGHVSASRGYIVYQKVDDSVVEKVKISELWEQEDAWDFDPMEHYFSNVHRELLYLPLGGTAQRIYIRNNLSTYRQWRMASGGDGIYFTLGPVGQRTGAVETLYYAPVRSGSLGDAVMVHQNVSDITGPFRDGILFTTGEEESLAVHVAQGGTADSLGSSIQVYGPFNGNASLLYLDMTGETSGDLYLLTREERLLASHVAAFSYRDDNAVYLLIESPDRSVRDLYLWQGGSIRLIEQAVKSLLGDSAA